MKGSQDTLILNSGNGERPACRGDGWSDRLEVVLIILSSLVSKVRIQSQSSLVPGPHPPTRRGSGDSLVPRPHPLTRRESGDYWALSWLCRVSTLSFEQADKIKHKTATWPFSSWEGGVWAQDESLVTCIMMYVTGKPLNVRRHTYSLVLYTLISTPWMKPGLARKLYMEVVRHVLWSAVYGFFVIKHNYEHMQVHF